MAIKSRSAFFFARENKLKSHWVSKLGKMIHFYQVWSKFASLKGQCYIVNVPFCNEIRSTRTKSSSSNFVLLDGFHSEICECPCSPKIVVKGRYKRKLQCNFKTRQIFCFMPLIWEKCHFGKFLQVDSLAFFQFSILRL